MVLSLIPLFEAVVYPLVAKHTGKPVQPLQKMRVGMVLAALPFLYLSIFQVTWTRLGLHEYLQGVNNKLTTSGQCVYPSCEFPDKEHPNPMVWSFIFYTALVRIQRSFLRTASCRQVLHQIIAMSCATRMQGIFALLLQIQSLDVDTCFE